MFSGTRRTIGQLNAWIQKKLRFLGHPNLQCNSILSMQCIHCTVQYTSVSVQCTLCSALTVYASPNLQIPKSWQCTYRLPFTWQCKVYCMYSIYCGYTVLLAADLQYILHPTASILHFGLGSDFGLVTDGKKIMHQPTCPTLIILFVPQL